MTPARIQRKRTKGFRLPPNTVCVSRGTRWGNPYRIEEHGRDRAVELFKADLLAGLIQPLEVLEELRGKNLACFCAPGELCHADVLLELANSPEEVSR